MAFGVFEASITSDQEIAIVSNREKDKLQAAIYDVTAEFGDFLLAARDKNEFNDRVALSMDSMMKCVDKTLPPKTGTMNRVVASQKKRWHQRHASLDNKSDSPTERDPDDSSKPHTSTEKTRNAIDRGDYGAVEDSVEPNKGKKSFRTASNYSWQRDPDDQAARVAQPEEDVELTVKPNGDDLWDWDCKSGGSSKGSGTTDDPQKAQQAAEDCYNIEVLKIYVDKSSRRTAGDESYSGNPRGGPYASPEEVGRRGPDHPKGPYASPEEYQARGMDQAGNPLPEEQEYRSPNPERFGPGSQSSHGYEEEFDDSMMGEDPRSPHPNAGQRKKREYSRTAGYATNGHWYEDVEEGGEPPTKPRRYSDDPNDPDYHPYHNKGAGFRNDDVWGKYDEYEDHPGEGFEDHNDRYFPDTPYEDPPGFDDTMMGESPTAPHPNAGQRKKREYSRTAGGFRNDDVWGKYDEYGDESDIGEGFEDHNDRYFPDTPYEDPLGKEVEPWGPNTHQHGDRLCDSPGCGGSQRHLQGGLEDAENLIPKDNWEGYLEERSTPNTRKLKRRDFNDRGVDDWENTGDRQACNTPMPPRREEEEEENERTSSLAVQMYSDFCDTNGLPKVSKKSFVAFAENISESEQRQVWAAIMKSAQKRQAGPEHPADTLRRELLFDPEVGGDTANAGPQEGRQENYGPGDPRNRVGHILAHTNKGPVLVAKQDGGDKTCPTCKAESGDPCLGDDDYELPFFHKTRKGAVVRKALGPPGGGRGKRTPVRGPKPNTATPGVGTEPYNPFQPGTGSQADSPNDPGYNAFQQPQLPQLPQPPKVGKPIARRRTAETDERSLLDKADKALTDLLNQRAQTFQETLGPLQQALQAIQYAEQVESTMAPMNVTSPAGTINPMPGQDPSMVQPGAMGGPGAVPGQPGAPMPGGDPTGGMGMGGPPEGAVPGMGGDPLMQGAQLAAPPDQKSSSRRVRGSVQRPYNRRMANKADHFRPQWWDDEVSSYGDPSEKPPEGAHFYEPLDDDQFDNHVAENGLVPWAHPNGQWGVDLGSRGDQVEDVRGQERDFDSAKGAVLNHIGDRVKSYYQEG
jgi:hypothetical protein